jgi:uncharacterized membrane protein
MKAYLLITGIIFGLVAIAHLLRLLLEGHPWTDFWFVGGNVLIFLVGGGIAAWAIRLFSTLRDKQ